MYVLMDKYACRGVYDSKSALQAGVDYWMKEFPKQTLVYEEWQANYIPEPFSWEWCYIAPGSKTTDLMKGGSSYIPSKRFRGLNLVNKKWAWVAEKTLTRLYRKLHPCTEVRESENERND